jgi:hypothetical protein
MSTIVIVIGSSIFVMLLQRSTFSQLTKHLQRLAITSSSGGPASLRNLMALNSVVSWVLFNMDLIVMNIILLFHRIYGRQVFYSTHQFFSNILI